MLRNSLPLILTGTDYWTVALPYFDFGQTIVFRPDGTGNMQLGANQGTTYFSVDFAYRYLSRDSFEFEYFDTPNVWQEMFLRTEQNAYQTIGFQLSEGFIERVCEYAQPCAFRYILEFDKEPFPIGYRSRTERLQYYGWEVFKPMN